MSHEINSSNINTNIQFQYSTANSEISENKKKYRLSQRVTKKAKVLNKTFNVIQFSGFLLAKKFG